MALLMQLRAHGVMWIRDLIPRVDQLELPDRLLPLLALLTASTAALQYFVVRK